ncbi:AbrB family transcriptional regulator [Rhizobium rhizosphaerae]|uniref:AbrB family transcriptional regulator n=1 Tax=Xaviernesmea rhizosphaerae TaxID=1672749 RepID=A0A1Q9AF50_9HYPH|nr:AbrB/MazE/SpoVT family DNA-binding domain-containing protein [Xaviernesmea rhizosphaerae]OLP53605.1 AbrB family transcriptional regulator [Xaviernesmea rhizosphaerae]OQP86322.1 AbrB family transcriptional regulator [Xaviernesmea rhizosphaerae]
MGAFATMTINGELAIPKEVREKLRLAPGTQFYVTVREGHLVAIPKTGRLRDLGGFLGAPPNGRALGVDEMDDALMDALVEDEERIRSDRSVR